MNIESLILEARVWKELSSTGKKKIHSDTWETLICEALGGTHIPGDIFMADGYVDDVGLNIKSINKPFTKKQQQTCDYIQCRCPLDDESNIGPGVISTLVTKREESFGKYNLKTMKDVFILHYRGEESYNVRVFIENQPEYESHDLRWVGNKAYIGNEVKQWKMKRNYGNDSSRQTCLLIKKTFDHSECTVDFSISLNDIITPSLDEILEEYRQLKSRKNECAERDTTGSGCGESERLCK